MAANVDETARNIPLDLEKQTMVATLPTRNIEPLDQRMMMPKPSNSSWMSRKTAARFGGPLVREGRGRQKNTKLPANTSIPKKKSPGGQVGCASKVIFKVLHFCFFLEKGEKHLEMSQLLATQKPTHKHIFAKRKKEERRRRKQTPFRI